MEASISLSFAYLSLNLVVKTSECFKFRKLNLAAMSNLISQGILMAVFILAFLYAFIMHDSDGLAPSLVDGCGRFISKNLFFRDCVSCSYDMLRYGARRDGLPYC